MDTNALKLPIRLVPRKRGQVVVIALFALFTGFAVYWTMMAAGVTGAIGLDAAPGSNLFLGLFPFLGIPFMLIGIFGMARAVLKLLPGSPYYHLAIGPEGLLRRSLFTRQHFAWRDLQGFEVLERRRHTKSGVRIQYFTVAMQPSAAGARRKEALRILADEYGAESASTDAADLAAWLDGLRQQAAQGRLDPDLPVDVPEGFRASAIGLEAIATRSVGRSAPVIEQAAGKSDRRPTVDRL